MISKAHLIRNNYIDYKSRDTTHIQTISLCPSYITRSLFFFFPYLFLPNCCFCFSVIIFKDNKSFKFKTVKYHLNSSKKQTMHKSLLRNTDVSFKLDEKESFIC